MGVEPKPWDTPVFYSPVKTVAVERVERVNVNIRQGLVCQLLLSCCTRWTYNIPLGGVHEQYYDHELRVNISVELWIRQNMQALSP